MHVYDAQAAIGFVTSQTAYVESQVNEIIYPDVQYRGLIPIDTGASPFAQTVQYMTSDKFGKADWINGNADDIPRAGSDLTLTTTPVYTAAIGYGWGWEEVNVAMALGVSLPNTDAAAARRAAEEMIDRVAFLGDATKNMLGLVNYTGVTAGAVVTGTWGTATADQILVDVNTVLLGTATDSAYIGGLVADTLLLPYGKLGLIATKRVPDTAMTVLEFLRMNNYFTATTGQALTIRGVRGLETAGASGVARMVAYRNDPSVLKMHVPMPHRFLPVYQQGPLRWDVPGVMRLGGLDIRRPDSVRYGDGI